MFQFVLLLLTVTRQLLTYLQERRLIAEGERKQLEKELVAAASAAKIAMEVRKEVGGLSDAQVDASLERDFRD